MIISIFFRTTFSTAWQYLREKEIASKSEGGRWALAAISEEHKKTVRKALAVYEDCDEKIEFVAEELIAFVKYMLREMETRYPQFLKLNHLTNLA